MPLSNYALLLLLMSIQFVNITDFMLVLPLAPDFVMPLQMSSADIGLLNTVYKSAAACSALFCAGFSFVWLNVRLVLSLSLLGLSIAIAVCGLAQSFGVLLGARFAAGLFTAPLTGWVTVCVIQHIPAEFRGRALAVVMLAFPLVTIISVPSGLALAHVYGWQLPFFLLAGLGIVISFLTGFYVPTTPISTAPVPAAPVDSGSDAMIAVGIYVTTALAMMSGFLIIPILSAYLQHNLAYPREQLAWLYFVGGTISIIAILWAGHFVDKWGSLSLAWWGTILFIAVIYIGFISPFAAMWVLPMFAGLMTAMSLRSMALTTFLSHHPAADHCSRFLAINAAVQHTAAALGSLLTVSLLQARADGVLIGIPQIALLTICLALTLPLLLGWLHPQKKSVGMVEKLI